MFKCPTLTLFGTAGIKDQVVVLSVAVSVSSQAVTSTVSDVVSLAFPVSHFLVRVCLPWANDCILQKSVVVALSVGNGVVSPLE